MDKTWAAIDKRARLRQQGNLPLHVARQLGREIKASLAADCRQRVVNAATEVKSHLGAGAVKEAWRTLKGWYRSAEDRPPPAGHDTLVKKTTSPLSTKNATISLLASSSSLCAASSLSVCQSQSLITASTQTLNMRLDSGPP